MEIRPKIIRKSAAVKSSSVETKDPKKPRYTIEDDKAILQTVKRCCGSTLPDRNIPWKRILEYLRKKKILSHSSADNLRDRYRRNLRPMLMKGLLPGFTADIACDRHRKRLDQQFSGSKAVAGGQKKTLNNDPEDLSNPEESDEIARSKVPNKAINPALSKNYESPPKSFKSPTRPNSGKEPKKAWVISPLNKRSASASPSNEKRDITLKIGPNLTVEDAWKKIRLHPQNKKLTMSMFADFYLKALELEGKPSQLVSMNIAMRYLVSLLDSQILGLQAISLSAMQFLKIMAK